MDSKVVQKMDPNNQELKLTRNQLEIDINWTQNEHETVFATEKKCFFDSFFNCNFLHFRCRKK